MQVDIFGRAISSGTSLFVAGDPVLFVVVVLVVVLVVHGHDGHGLANISLFSNALLA